MPHEVETMFYAGATPWHGLGVGVEKAKTSAEAISLAGLDWDVELGPVWAGADEKRDAFAVPDKYAIYRRERGKEGEPGYVSPQVYHTGVTDSYEALQNAEIFDFLDSLLQDGVVHYETAGSLFNGAKVWALAKLDEDMRVGDDIIVPYMLMTAGHDLVTSIEVLPTTVRVVCNNTLTSAVAQGPVGMKRVKIAHNRNMRAKLEQARNALQITTAAQRRMQEWLDTLSTTKLTENKVDAVVDGIFGGALDENSSAQKRNQVGIFRSILKAEEERVGRTGYAVVNAITGFADHKLTYNGTEEDRRERRFLSVVNGRAEQWKENALEAFAGVEPKASLVFTK